MVPSRAMLTLQSLCLVRTASRLAEKFLSQNQLSVLHTFAARSAVYLTLTADTHQSLAYVQFATVPSVLLWNFFRNFSLLIYVHNF